MELDFQKLLFDIGLRPSLSLSLTRSCRILFDSLGQDKHIDFFRFVLGFLVHDVYTIS